MPNHAELKRLLFERDGWREPDPETGNDRWFARCVGGCGRTLTKTTSTVDRYPVPGANGGTYHLDNTRLACASCNSRFGSHGHVGPSLTSGMSDWQRRVWHRAMRRGKKPVITPTEIFGPNYVPGQNKPEPSTSRHPVKRVETFNSRSTQGSESGQRINDDCICPRNFHEPWLHRASCPRFRSARSLGRHVAMRTPGFPMDRDPGSYVGRHRA